MTAASELRSRPAVCLDMRTLWKDRPWAQLMVLAVAQFMVLLDVTIVNIALPGIGTLGFTSTAGLQWVVSAYALIFGGFLLLGGALLSPAAFGMVTLLFVHGRQRALALSM